jgi:hypothetical protein
MDIHAKRRAELKSGPLQMVLNLYGPKAAQYVAQGARTEELADLLEKFMAHTFDPNGRDYDPEKPTDRAFVAAMMLGEAIRAAKPQDRMYILAGIVALAYDFVNVTAADEGGASHAKH